MHLEVSGAGDVLAVVPGEPDGVLSGVGGAGVLQLEGEVVLLGHDLDAVGELVVERLVVLEPGGREAGDGGVGGA